MHEVAEQNVVNRVLWLECEPVSEWLCQSCNKEMCGRMGRQMYKKKNDKEKSEFYKDPVFQLVRIMYIDLQL
jgi:hypothetical protein